MERDNHLCTARRALALALLLGLAASLVACADEKGANQLPVFTRLPGEVLVQVGEAVDLTVTAEDPDGGSVTLSLEVAPEGAEFIAPSGLGRFHWAPLASDAARSHEVVFAARDASGGRSTARLLIEVEAADGSPRFVSPPQRVLDLARSDTLVAQIQVKDDDSTEVALSLDQPPKGMVLVQTSDKDGELTWTPSPEQIATQSVWTATLVADDGTGGRATQTLSVILIAKEDCSQDQQGQCGCAPPLISHEPLPDQRRIEDYTVVSNITDSESKVVEATLFYTDGDPEDLDGYTSLEMAQEGARFSAPIPNPLLAQGQSRLFSYFICARDNDDPNGETCDNVVCVPQDRKFGFTAFAPGDADSCRADMREPNDAPSQASFVVGGFASNLTICAGDKDLFGVPVQAGDSVEALITYTAANGNLKLRLLAPDGQTLIEEQDAPGDEEFIASGPLPSAGTYLLEVSGAQNSYDLLLDVVRADVGPCDDAFEPNESAQQAVPLEPDAYEGLSICEGDRDVFAVAVRPGDELSATIFFEHAVGDLDMVLYAPGDGRVLSRSVSVTDNEVVSHRLFERAGDAIVEITGFGTDAAPYDLLVEVSGGNGDQCSPDASEPNDSVAQATRIVNGDARSLRICANEQDFFVLALDEGERAEVSIAFDATSDLDLFVLAPDGAETLTSSEGVDGTEVVRWTALEAGNHFATVIGFEGDEGDYDLSVRTCDNDQDDPNDLPELASPMVNGAFERRLCLGEQDWYALRAPAGAVVIVDIDAPNIEGLEAVVLAEDGRTVVQRLAREGAILSSIFEVREARTLLLRVGTSDPSGPTRDYEVLVDID